jgi:hypothetical protein
MDGLRFSPEMAPTSGQQSGITVTEQGLTQLAAVASRGSSVSVAAAGLATSALHLILPEAARRAALAPTAVPAPAPAGVLPGACAVVGDGSIVWHKCLDAGFTIDGTIGWGPGRVAIHVDLVGTALGQGFDFTLSGGLAVSPSLLLGDINVSGTASYNGGQFTQEVDMHIDADLVDGCISSGELAVSANGSGAGAKDGAVLVIWTGCHSFRVRNG